jgi:amino acid transporter
VYWRFGIFFIGGALTVGIILPYNDPKLLTAGNDTAAGSPYVIAMSNMGISVLPHILNALLVTCIFSAGNAYVFCAMRSLHGLALEGHAPAVFRKCTRQGIPVYCFLATMIFPFLSLLQVSHSSAQVITWLANLTEASQLLNYIIMCITYLCFHRGMKAQGFDRSNLPYVGWLQPGGAITGAIGMSVVLGGYGYATFLPGNWDVGTFFSYYAMVFVACVTFLGWKIIKGTRFVRPTEVDLVWERPSIDLYEAHLVEDDHGFWSEIRQTLSLGRK